ncbi:glycine zipper family protein [Nitrosomonas sp. sh817]|jgi:hypothetical protein|uniref:glycine zipper family protein n=1 Tax=unclassified Nitrosomonas TaxID=2609265 RepID=UPI0027DD9383|nr:glycine zipper family protein [Nitrosomonas sp. sh817]WMJ07387.1 glycine zipper family protein [Nitrosomonas sp. sh817]
MKILTISLVGLIFLSLSACSTTGPVIYPNSHFLSVGKQVAEQDIEACRELAESSGAKEGAGQLGNVATGTAMGAGVGAASGAVGGAIYGAAGQGSLIGAASGATAGFLRSLLFSSRSSKPNSAYINFVSRCLQEKGYEVTGWQ